MIGRIYVSWIVVVAVSAAGNVQAKAKPGRFVVDEKDVTVLDNLTKLTWQRVVPGQANYWQAAKDYCKSLSLAGGGWRLPTVRELQSIVDFGHNNPSIDKTAFPNTPSENFWSATATSATSSYAWSVHFNNGNSDYGGIIGTYRIRCVR